MLVITQQLTMVCRFVLVALRSLYSRNVKILNRKALLDTSKSSCERENKDQNEEKSVNQILDDVKELEKKAEPPKEVGGPSFFERTRINDFLLYWKFLLLTSLPFIIYMISFILPDSKANLFELVMPGVLVVLTCMMEVMFFLF